MKKFLTLFLLASLTAHAGDDASGSIHREMDLGKKYTTYQLKKHDHTWSNSLVKNLGYKGKVHHFVKTTLPLLSNGKVIEGRVYQHTKHADWYYVAEGDLMFKVGENHPHSPGTGGFSMHTPQSKNFIVCLKCKYHGVPLKKSTKVIKGKVTWYGTAGNRF